MKQEEKIFEEYIASQNLKHSEQRSEILRVFLEEDDRHLSAEDLYNIVKKKNPDIGYTTVYRTLRLLCECGLASELKFEDGITRYEHCYGHQHHDHLICTNCGKFVEILDEDIEDIQNRIFKKYGFAPQRHKMELYGVCKECKKDMKK